MTKEVKVEKVESAELHVSVCDAARAKIVGQTDGAFVIESDLAETEVAVWFTDKKGKIVKEVKLVVNFNEDKKSKKAKKAEKVEKVEVEQGQPQAEQEQPQAEQEQSENTGILGGLFGKKGKK